MIAKKTIERSGDFPFLRI